VRLLLRCLAAAVLFLAVVMPVSALTFNGLLAMLGWPGVLVVNAACARFEIYAPGSDNLGPMLIAGFLIDVAIYTLLFFVVVKGWRMLVPEVAAKQ
jgi:hypothetical protein